MGAESQKEAEKNAALEALKYLKPIEEVKRAEKAELRALLIAENEINDEKKKVPFTREEKKAYREKFKMIQDFDDSLKVWVGGVGGDSVSEITTYFMKAGNVMQCEKMRCGSGAVIYTTAAEASNAINTLNET